MSISGHKTISSYNITSTADKLESLRRRRRLPFKTGRFSSENWLAALDDFRTWLLREAPYTVRVSPLFRQTWAARIQELQAPIRLDRIAIAGVLAVIFVAGIILFAGLDFSKISVADWTILGAILASVWFYWWLTRIEKTPKGRVAFGIAVELEDSKEAQQLRSDFVITLRNLIAGCRLKGLYQNFEQQSWQP